MVFDIKIAMNLLNQNNNIKRNLQKKASQKNTKLKASSKKTPKTNS